MHRSLTSKCPQLNMVRLGMSIIPARFCKKYAYKTSWNSVRVSSTGNLQKEGLLPFPFLSSVHSNRNTNHVSVQQPHSRPLHHILGKVALCLPTLIERPYWREKVVSVARHSNNSE